MGVNSQASAELIQPGRWVEIRSTVLESAERAPQVPEDTGQVPLEMRARGFLLRPAVPGDEVEVETVTGRRLRGVLHSVEPAYTHGFGPPVRELLGIAGELRALLDPLGRES
jgi:hypothetical protein